MTIEKVDVKFFDVPTETEERDGTLTWSSTGLVTVEIEANGNRGLGYTYADITTAEFITAHALPMLLHENEKNNLLLIEKIKHAGRNLGYGSVFSMALSAIDTALWDLKARQFDISIQELLGVKRGPVHFYGSGLFINNSDEDLIRQIEKFHSYGVHSFKMKIGEGLERDIERVIRVLSLLPEGSEIFVDANAAYSPKEALALARALNELNVTYFEEPINSFDIAGMEFLKERFPDKMNLVAGEYCFLLSDVMNLLKNEAVDILQVDATRCEGTTGSLMASHLARAFHIPLSTHCAPLLHGNIGPCMDNLRMGELFYDHLRIEEHYFYYDGKYSGGKFEPSKKQKGFGWKLNPDHREHLAYEHVSTP